jgi:hypothetical protein
LSDQAPNTSEQREAPSAVATTESAPTRWNVLMRNPKRLVIALVLIVIAIAAAAFASATFTSTSANPGNLAATGSLKIDNSNPDAAILTATGLVPGDSRNGSVTISNVGDSAGDFSLTTQDLVDTPPTPPLSGHLDLLIEDVTVPATPTETYRGKLNGVGTVQLGRWASGATHTYRFTLTFPDGTPATDNQYQNAQSTVSFVWNAVS